MDYKEFRSAEYKYPLALETINDQEMDELAEWIRTHPRLTMGPLTKQFEQEWAKWVGRKYAVFVNSGSSANLLMAYAAKEKAGRGGLGNVCVPRNGWATSVAPFLQMPGIEYVNMINVDSKTWGMNLDHLEGSMTRCSAVLFVHPLGVPHHDPDRLRAACRSTGAYLLEDACAALGSRYEDGRMVGTIGDMASFSLYFGHQMSTIEGGMVVTDDEEFYHILLMLRSHGWDKDLPRDYADELARKHSFNAEAKPFIFHRAGFNTRPTDLQAFLGLQQMKKADYVSRRRHENHMLYASNLGGRFGIQTFGKNQPASISFAATADSDMHREIILSLLKKTGIETRVYTAGNLGRHPFWPHHNAKDMVADMLFYQGFFLPNYPELTEDDINYICEVVSG